MESVERNEAEMERVVHVSFRLANVSSTIPSSASHLNDLYTYAISPPSPIFLTMVRDFSKLLSLSLDA